jgi:DNA polymerase V
MRAGEQLRAHGLVAGQLATFFHTSPHRPGRTTTPRGAWPWRRWRPTAAGSSPPALRCVEAAWREGRGCRYAKAGVLLADLCPASAAPLDVFAAASPRRAALMAAMDRVNARYGRDTLFPAAAGVERRWDTQAAHRSPRYTTRLDELPVIAPCILPKSGD